MQHTPLEIFMFVKPRAENSHKANLYQDEYNCDDEDDEVVAKKSTC